MAEAEVVDAADLGVARGDDDRAFVVEHLPELAEAGVVRRPFDDQAVFLLAHVAVGRDRAQAVGEALFHLGAQELVVVDGVIGAAEGAEDRPDVVDAAEIGVDRRRLVLGALQHANQIVLRLHRLLQVLAQPVDVELHAGDALELGDHLLLELLDHVLGHVLGDLAVAHVGRVQHDRLALVLLAQQLEPLHEGEAAGVGEQQHVGIGEFLAVRREVALRHHANVRLHVGADVLGVADLLGFKHEGAAGAAQPVLDGVDLGQIVDEAEAHDQLVEIARHESRRDLLAGLRRAGEPIIVGRPSSPSASSWRHP